MTPLPTREVAERLGVPLSTLHGWIDSGKLVPTLKGPGLRGPMFFAPADVEKLRAELTAEAEARLAALAAAPVEIESEPAGVES